MIKSTFYAAVIMAALMVSCEPADAAGDCSDLWIAREYPAWLECRGDLRSQNLADLLNESDAARLHREVEDLEADIDTLMDTIEDFEYEYRNRR